MNTRNIGLDLLRLLAMFMVVLIHVNNFGGLLQNKFFSVDFLPIYLFESLGVVAVNCFVLISGFFLIKQEFRLKKLIALIVEILFYSYLCFIIALIIKFPIVVKMFIKSLFPITFSAYWFVSCYIMLYILFPFINKFIYSLSLKQKHIFAVITLFLFCIWTFIPAINSKATCGGYTILWLSILYYWGAYIRLVFIDINNQENFVKLRTFLGYIFCSLITLGLSVLLNIMGKTIWYALDYNKMFVFLASICLFLFMYKLNIKNVYIKKLIAFFAPASFGIYLISSNMFFVKYQKTILDKEFFIQSFNMPLMVLICAICIFIVCLLISSLFHKRIFAFSDKYVYPIIEKVFNYVKNKILSESC